MPQKRPRLVYVVTLAEVGGAQSYIRDLLPAVLEEFDVTVAAHGHGPLRDAADALGVPFVALQHVRREPSLLHDPLGLLELVGLFRRIRPDIVHLNSSKAGILGRLAAPVARVPSRVFTAHGWAFKAGHGRAASLYLWADRLVRPLTTTVICVSETERAAGLAARTCTPSRTVVIPNAVDVGERPSGERRRVGPVEIVTVGRLAEPKDFVSLISAIALLPPDAARLRVIGGGPLRPDVEAQVAELGLAASVELVGEVNDVPRRLREADVFVLSSRSEGMPMSVLEAMAAGLPVVASDVGGVHEVVVDGETGFLTPAGDPEALADALGRLVADPELRERLGSAGRLRVEERFALPRWQGEHLALYRQLLAARLSEAN